VGAASSAESYFEHMQAQTEDANLHLLKLMQSIASATLEPHYEWRDSMPLRALVERAWPAARGQNDAPAALELVSSMDGSISAAHGIGVAKRSDLPLSRTSADIDAMWALKRALDPFGILNPGVLLPDPLTGGAGADGQRRQVHRPAPRQRGPQRGGTAHR